MSLSPPAYTTYRRSPTSLIIATLSRRKRKLVSPISSPAIPRATGGLGWSGSRLRLLDDPAKLTWLAAQGAPPPVPPLAESGIELGAKGFVAVKDGYHGGRFIGRSMTAICSRSTGQRLAARFSGCRRASISGRSTNDCPQAGPVVGAKLPRSRCARTGAFDPKLPRFYRASQAARWCQAALSPMMASIGRNRNRRTASAAVSG
jgi:hypothetical protein